MMTDDSILQCAFGRNNSILPLIISKFTSVISLIASTYVIYDIFQDVQRRKESIYHRLMVGVSISDILLSLGVILFSSIPPTKIGNCTIINYFSFFTVTVATLYLCSLSTFYLLQLKFNLKIVQMKAWEKWFHFFPWVVGVTLAGIRIATSTSIYFPIGTYLVSLLYIITTMFLVYRHVLKIEMDALKFSIHQYKKTSTKGCKPRSRRVMIQGALYCTSLILTCIFPIFKEWTSRTKANQMNIIAGSILFAIFLPLHGFYNFLIYNYPVFQRWGHSFKEMREERKQKSTKHQNSGYDDVVDRKFSVAKKFRSFLFGQNDVENLNMIANSDTCRIEENKLNDDEHSTNDIEEKPSSRKKGLLIAKGNLDKYYHEHNDDDEEDTSIMIAGSLIEMVTPTSTTQHTIIDQEKTAGTMNRDSLTQLGLRRNSLIEMRQGPYSRSLSDLDQYVNLESGESLKRNLPEMKVCTRDEKKTKPMNTTKNDVCFLPGGDIHQEQEEIFSTFSLELPLGEEDQPEDSHELPKRKLERQKSLRNLLALLESMEKACLS